MRSVDNSHLALDILVLSKVFNMKRLFRYSFVGLLLIVMMATLFSAGVVLGSTGLSASAAEGVQFQTLGQVWDLVQQDFVDRGVLEDPTALEYAAIRGLIDALGDEGHTRFLSPEEAARQQASIAGKFSGIGAQVGEQGGLPVIVAPLLGRIDNKQRRVSFFDPSPTANSVSVEEGHLVTFKVPFFWCLLGGISPTTGRRCIKMFKDTVRGIVNKTENTLKRMSTSFRGQPQLRSGRRDERVVMWYGGQRVDLPVDAWIRGH